MLNAQDLPYGIRSLIAGFGEPTQSAPQNLPNGSTSWIATWDGAGVSACWEENAAGSVIIGTFHVSLDERIWRGRKPIFTQIVNASRAWAG